ncbi:hypothetical protein [Mycetocola sp. JXN-3]|uniref:hypothetical protein n=1 Tax=Mycetocola sp. JXN-3 TaxID=2116510 RepID=UPI00165CF886|nr:hypothetical protein [Mycetocola sp. JXN-3]
MSATRIIAASLIAMVCGACLGAILVALPDPARLLTHWDTSGGALVGAITGIAAFLAGYAAWASLRRRRMGVRRGVAAGLSALVGGIVVTCAEMSTHAVHPFILPVVAAALILCMASVGARTQGARFDAPARELTSV